MQCLSAAGHFISDNRPWLLFVQKVKGQIGHTHTRVCKCTNKVTSNHNTQHILFVFVSDLPCLAFVIKDPSIYEMLSVFKMFTVFSGL